MGITIDVASVIYPRSRARAETLYNKQSGWQAIKTLCDAFQCDKVPWEDPSEQHGIRTSANYSRYYLFRAVTLDFDKGAKGNYQRFPHLLEYDLGTTTISIYMPIEVPYPIHLQCQYEVNFTGTLAIGSARRLQRELEELEPLLRQIVAEKGEKTRVTEYSNTIGHTWGGVYSLCSVLQTAAQESQELNLPICIRF